METPLATEETDQAEQVPNPVRRPAIIAVAAVAGVVLVFTFLLITLRASRPGALPGIELNGIQLGGLEGQELVDAVARVGEERGRVVLTVTRDTDQVVTNASDLGYAFLVDETVDAVMERGRQANPLAALLDHVRAFGGRIPIQGVQQVDERGLETWAQGIAEQLALTPVEGAVRFEGAQVVRVDPEEGALVDADYVARRAREALLLARATTFEARTDAVEPQTSSVDVDAVFNQATLAVSAPLRLTRGGAALVIEPEEIGTILKVEERPDENPALRLVADPAAVEQLVTPQERAAIETEPVNARITLSGGVVAVTDSAPGFTFDPAATAARVLELATADGPREGELPGQTLEPSLSTEQARGLNIAQQVSTFTTNHVCCESRVTNIHRIADIVDGAVIRPGETFSLNGFVGPRTPEKGFVEGGAIHEGEFVEQVGGGVSQFTTTMFNAAYFGGYDIVEHKPHSYYISRYPEGREATLNYPTVDLKFRNDSPHGILVDTSYTDTSVTVSFWATPWVAVESVTGPRTNPTTAGEIRRRNPELTPGTEQVVQEGGLPGFDVTVTRILRFPDGRSDSEVFSTRYDAEPRIVEFN